MRKQSIVDERVIITYSTTNNCRERLIHTFNTILALSTDLQGILLVSNLSFSYEKQAAIMCGINSLDRHNNLGIDVLLPQGIVKIYSTFLEILYTPCTSSGVHINKCTTQLNSKM